MWHETSLETLLKKQLKTLDLSVLHHDKFYQQYEQVRQYMRTEIYPNITRIEPNLSDHGEVHIQNVLHNAYKLIEYPLNRDNKYTPLDLYVLCSAILIHDIGNIHGRHKHETALENVYMSNKVFSNIDTVEKRIVSKIATSHGGMENAISTLSDEENISGKRIRSKCIAGLLRFADELAEGPQRTSTYMLNNSLISNESSIYHQYASISESPVIALDAVILKYNIAVSNFLENELGQLLLMLYSRIYKLNRERINCGIYSEHIQKIKKVAVTINFFKEESSLSTIKVDRQLTIFELNNLNCTLLKEVQLKTDYIDPLVLGLKKHCKQESP